jgi:hypothetical protein
MEMLCYTAPTFVAITQMWWRRSEQTNRVAAWYSMLGVVNMVSGFDWGRLVIFSVAN